MKIEINVDELQFKEILEGELKNLSQDKLHEVIYQGIHNYLESHPDLIKDLFVEKSNWSWQTYPTSLLKEVMCKSIPVDAFKDIADGLINELKTNYNTILRDAMLEMMIRGMFESYGFKSCLSETLYRLKQEQANN